MVGLFLLAAAFGVKRWRYLRSRKAEEEYGKRRWGQARVMNDVRPSRKPPWRCRLWDALVLCKQRCALQGGAATNCGGMHMCATALLWASA